MSNAELLAGIRRRFVHAMQTDKRVRSLLKRVRDGTYVEAGEYAVRVGELLSEALQADMADLPSITEEVARAILPPMLSLDHDLVCAVCETVQKNMNKANGIGLSAQLPKLDTNRIAGFISKVSSYETTEEALWVLGEPVVNYSQAVVDQSIRDNARVQTDAGFDAYIVRETEAYRTVHGVKRVRSPKGKVYSYGVSYTEPCRWCQSLAGKYRYEDVSDTGNNVFRRHEACRCTVTYELGKNRQNVWTKAQWTEKDAAKSRNRIEDRQREFEQRQNSRLQEIKNRLLNN